MNKFWVFFSVLQIQESNIHSEEQFQQEINARVKLADLYKVSVMCKKKHLSSWLTDEIFIFVSSIVKRERSQLLRHDMKGSFMNFGFLTTMLNRVDILSSTNQLQLEGWFLTYFIKDWYPVALKYSITNVTEILFHRQEIACNTKIYMYKKCEGCILYINCQCQWLKYA